MRNLDSFIIKMKQILIIIYISHLSIYTEKGGIVAVGRGRVGSSDGILPGEEGDGGFVKVAVDAAEGVERLN